MDAPTTSERSPVGPKAGGELERLDALGRDVVGDASRARAADGRAQLVRSARVLLRRRLRFARRIRGVRVGGKRRPVANLAWRGRLSARRRLVLSTELALLFFAFPLSLVALQGAGVPVPTIPALLIVTLLSWGILLFDPGFPRRELSNWRVPRGELVRVLGLFAVGAVGLVGLTQFLRPGELFSLPRSQPGLWLAILVFYPLLSVYPQELVWRVFFVHRYARLLRSQWLAVVLSALAFGFVHLLYGSWFSVGLSTMGGVLFGITYLRTRSIGLVCLEHSFYGCWLFTVGLHEYFYRGF